MFPQAHITAFICSAVKKVTAAERHYERKTYKTLCEREEEVHIFR